MVEQKVLDFNAIHGYNYAGKWVVRLKGELPRKTIKTFARKAEVFLFVKA